MVSGLPGRNASERYLLYGYSLGIMSSRRIERAAYEDLAFRYLSADQHPDHDTIADFHRATPGISGAIIYAGAPSMRRVEMPVQWFVSPVHPVLETRLASGSSCLDNSPP
jgi:hypothetical protein